MHPTMYAVSLLGMRNIQSEALDEQCDGRRKEEELRASYRMCDYIPFWACLSLVIIGLSLVYHLSIWKDDKPMIHDDKHISDLIPCF